MYKLIRPLLFCMPPEVAHDVTLGLLKFSYKFLNLFPKPKSSPRTVMGLYFPNSVGLAAGLDKSGDYIDALAALGFGFIEIGTVTPQPQPGNPKPRIFRYPKQNAIINRMGFNNKGCDYLVERLKKMSYTGILGINIGKNSNTPIERAVDDYLYCWQRVAPYASYITINISSPNTKGLRELQRDDLLQPLLKTLKAEQAKQVRYVPLVVKIAPDLTSEELTTLAEILLQEKVDGVIATNTTLSRIGVDSTEAGGLSGQPLTNLATTTIQQLKQILGTQIPIIASGGILTANDAKAKLATGAVLVQLYTVLIYNGSSLINSIINF
jgi:dihydroorotate dehydrogenase